MENIGGLLERGIRYVRQYGAVQLYRKIQERRQLNRLEAPYQAWLTRSQPGIEKLKAQREDKDPLAPRISILVPAYETPREFLLEMVESVRNQTYENWELCIADGSKSNQVEKALEKVLGQEPRICYQHLKENGGISQNTNAALAMAQGEYVALLDHDDLLFPQTLYEVAKAIRKNPQAEVFYTDEDKVSFDTKRHFQPHFKPDFNLELLRSNNYICHFFVVNRERAQRVGGFLSEFDGAQDYDFIFRCVEQGGPVVHIPEILYSWRSHASSTAADPESKLYAYQAGRRAVAAHLARLGETGQVVDTENYGFYRVKYRGKKARREENGKTQKQVLINSFENLHGQKGIKVVYYGKVRNKIVTFRKRDVTDDYVLFTCVKKGKVTPGFFRELRVACERPGVGMACARVYDVHGRLSHSVVMAGVRNPLGITMKGLKKGYLGYFHRACLQQELLEPTDCFLIKGKLLEELLRRYKEGDSDKDTVTLDMVWMGAQVRKMGRRIMYEPWAVLYEQR